MVSKQQCHGDIRHYDRMGHNANEFSTQTLHALESDTLDMSALKNSWDQCLAGLTWDFINEVFSIDKRNLLFTLVVH